MLALAGLDLASIFPEDPYLPLNPRCESRHRCIVDNKSLAFIVNNETGACRWDVPCKATSCHVRLSLCPDEGGPLFAGYQYLAHHNASIALHRDEWQLGQMASFGSPNCVIENRHPYACECQSQAPRLLWPCHILHCLCETPLAWNVIAAHYGHL